MREIHGQTKLAQHIVQDVIVMIAQLAGHNLQRHVAIAKVIAGLRQHKGVIAAYDRNGFIGGDHFDELAAVFVAENIAAAQQ